MQSYKKFLVYLLISAEILYAQANGNSDNHKPSRQAAKGGLTAYDQRQTGKFNIHLNIKDVQLISLKGDRFGAGVGDETVYDYGDYDYNPGDFTVNPLIALLGMNNSTTAKPSTITHVNVSSSQNNANITKASAVVVSQPSHHAATGGGVGKSKVNSSSVLLTTLSNVNHSPAHHPIESSNDTPPPIRILVKPSVKKLIKRRKHKPIKRVHKPPFRLRAVYRRPHQRVQVVPRKVLNEFVIEAPSNDRGEEDDEDFDVEEPEEIETEALEIDDEEDDEEYEGSPDGNTNKKKKNKRKPNKRKKNKKKVPYEYYEQYEPEPYIHTIYRPPPVYEYEYLEEHDDDDDILGLKSSSLEEVFGLYTLINLWNRRNA